MLPIVRGDDETRRQILWYSLLLVALTAVIVPFGLMGPVYLVAALVLGALFLRQAWGLWRRGDSVEESTAGAIRLYRYSISYLTLLFAAIALDTLVLAAFG
jgi:protoheme IX farnesyltransferase